MKNRALVTLLKLALIGGLATTVLTGCGEANSEPQAEIIKPVKLYQVPDYAVSDHDAFLANVDAGERSQLSFQVPGEINKVLVRDGQKVVKDQLLASLDPKDYQLAVDAAQAQFDLAETRYLRDKQLYTKRLISASAFDSSETDYKAAVANLEEAKTDFSYTSIKAPFDGIVSLSFVTAHQFVAAKQPVLNIINNEELDIELSIPVPYIDSVGVNTFKQQSFRVVLDMAPDTIIPAQFKEMSTQPNSETNSFNATVTILRPDSMNILTGMSGQVYVSSTSQEHVVRLPESAWVSRDSTTGRVWRFDSTSNTVELLELKLNESGSVSEGLNSGDLIVIAGTKDLEEGQIVRAWTREGGI